MLSGRMSYILSEGVKHLDRITVVSMYQHCQLDVHVCRTSIQQLKITFQNIRTWCNIYISSLLFLYNNDKGVIPCTVDSRYLELGYLEFCETRRVYLNQKYILIAFPSRIWRWILFYKSKLPEVQINLHFG